jgi:hypothetical protein
MFGIFYILGISYSSTLITIDREKDEFIKQTQLPSIHKRTFKFKIMLPRNRCLKDPEINLLKMKNLYYKNQI